MSTTDNTPILDVENLTKSFGGIVAVDNVSFEIMPGEVRALIGPNGAGKTTLFNCVSGTYDISGGDIQFKDEAVTDLAAHEMANRGLSRSYQVTNLFNGLTAFENVRLAVQIATENNLDVLNHFTALEETAERAEEILERIGLSDQHDVEVSAMSHGEKRQLEIGVAIGMDPDLLLLDEPTAGLSSDQVDTMTNLIEDIGQRYTIFLVEHNMDVVMSLSDTVMVMDQGSLIASGSPDQIRNDERVRQAYLGAEDDEMFTPDESLEGAQ